MWEGGTYRLNAACFSCSGREQIPKLNPFLVLKEGSKLFWPDNGEKLFSNSRVNADGYLTEGTYSKYCWGGGKGLLTQQSWACCCRLNIHLAGCYGSLQVLPKLPPLKP